MQTKLNVLEATEDLMKKEIAWENIRLFTLYDQPTVVSQPPVMSNPQQLNPMKQQKYYRQIPALTSSSYEKSLYSYIDSLIGYPQIPPKPTYQPVASQLPQPRQQAYEKDNCS